MRGRTLTVLAILLLLSTACAWLPLPRTASPTLPGEAPSPLPPATRTLPSPTVAVTATATFPPMPVEFVVVTVYFTDSARYAAGTPPFEVGVRRLVLGTRALPISVLQEFFLGPTPEEQAQGLVAITSGFNGFSRLDVEDGVARVYLIGTCSSLGATYTVAQPIMANLLQFPDVQVVKIYDENGTTENPDGEGHSIPFCLEP